MNDTLDKDTPVKSVLSNVVIRATDRSPKDIQTWNNAILAAESPQYPTHTRLYDLYTSIMLDGHLGGIVDKRIDTVLNKELIAERRDSEGSYLKADEFDDLIDSLAFRDMCRERLLTIIWGRSACEAIPGPDFDIREIPRKHIKMKTQKIAYEQSDLDNGISYAGLSNVWVTGKSNDLGLLASVAQYALLKRGDLADWSNYVEIFGMPAWVFKYDAYDEQTKAALDKIIDNVGSALRIRIPKQADVEPMDGKTANGNGELQEKLFHCMNMEMSIRILGNTETTNSSKSSGYAQGKIHQEQQAEITKSDINYLRALLNSKQFRAILTSYGYNMEGVRFAFPKENDILKQAEEVKIASTLKNELDVPLDDDDLYERFGYAKPKDYDQQKAEIAARKSPASLEEDPADEETKPSRPVKKKKALAAHRSFFQKALSFFGQAHG